VTQPHELERPEFATPELTVRAAGAGGTGGSWWIVTINGRAWRVLATAEDTAIIEAWVLERGMRRRDGTRPPDGTTITVVPDPD